MIYLSFVCHRKVAFPPDFCAGRGPKTDKQQEKDVDRRGVGIEEEVIMTDCLLSLCFRLRIHHIHHIQVIIISSCQLLYSISCSVIAQNSCDIVRCGRLRLGLTAIW